MATFFDPLERERIRKGYYSAKYFNRTKSILLKEENFKSVTMQVFQRNDEITLCGIEEVMELFRLGTGYFEGRKWIDMFEAVTISSLQDGDKIAAQEPVMHIQGPYAYFAHLESVYLGILARRTAVATRVRQAVNAAQGKQILFFADRFDYFLNQAGDGFAAHSGGATAVSTDAQAFLWNGQAVGTIPHAFIAINNGDTVLAAKLFVKHFPGVLLIVLVDFDNDCVATSLAVAKELGNRLWGVRVDTSANIKDISVGRMKGKDLSGVNPTLIKLLRKALDNAGFAWVKIIVSGGFNKDRVERFEKEKTPVDIYGIGSWFVQGTNIFTADVVQVAAKPLAKFGREYSKNPRLKIRF